MIGRVSVAVLALASAAHAVPYGGWRNQWTTQVVVETAVETAYATVVAGEAAASPTSASIAVQYTSQAASEGESSTSVASPTSSVAGSSTQASTPSSSGSSGSSGNGAKRGACFVTAEQAVAISGSAWGYNWASSATGLDESITYAPMLWSANANSADRIAAWPTDAQAAIDKYGKEDTFLLGPNEPDRDDQADMTVEEAITAWGLYMEPFAGKASLGAPAVTSQDAADMSLDGWLVPFLNDCKVDGNPCTIDFIPIHWYGPPDQAEAFKTYVQKAYDLTGKDLWITEFGVYTDSGAEPTADDQKTFLDDTLSWLEEQSFVKKYAYFGTTTTMLSEVASDLSNVVSVLESFS